jgi:hypothetical protein
MLAPLVGGSVNKKHIVGHWEILRLGTSIKHDSVNACGHHLPDRLIAVASNPCSECMRLLDQYRACIEQARALENQAAVVELTRDRNKAWRFKIGFTVLQRRAAALKQEYADHQEMAHQQWV